MKIKEKNKFKIKDKLKQLKNIAYDDADSLLISKQKEIFDKLVDQRYEEITNFDKKANSDDTMATLLMQILINLLMLLVFWIKQEMVK